MLNLLAFLQAQCLEHIHQLLRTEQPHQIIFQRDIEP